jgi:hypothetical protein
MQSIANIQRKRRRVNRRAAEKDSGGDSLAQGEKVKVQRPNHGRPPNNRFPVFGLIRSGATVDGKA